MQHVILVTGATGHVGRHVVSQLLQTSAAVRALTRNPDLLACRTELRLYAATYPTRTL